MTIEIIIGLPHLNEGPILERARTLQTTALISANGLSRWSGKRGWREWIGWRPGQLRNARGLAGLCLDSAGFVAASRYGGFPWTLHNYVELAAAYPFRWWASADYCVEPEIAGDREEVVDRLSRTIRANRDCRRIADDFGIGDTMMPVIQGRSPTDYERCADALSGLLRPTGILGVGSMCRRDIHGPEGLIAVIDHLDRILPGGIQLHALASRVRRSRTSFLIRTASPPSTAKRTASARVALPCAAASRKPTRWLPIIWNNGSGRSVPGLPSGLASFRRPGPRRLTLPPPIPGKLRLRKLAPKSAT